MPLKAALSLSTLQAATEVGGSCSGTGKSATVTAITAAAIGDVAATGQRRLGVDANRVGRVPSEGQAV